MWFLGLCPLGGAWGGRGIEIRFGIEHLIPSAESEVTRHGVLGASKTGHEAWTSQPTRGDALDGWDCHLSQNHSNSESFSSWFMNLLTCVFPFLFKSDLLLSWCVSWVFVFTIHFYLDQNYVEMLLPNVSTYQSEASAGCDFQILQDADQTSMTSVHVSRKSWENGGETSKQI